MRSWIAISALATTAAVISISSGCTSTSPAKSKGASAEASDGTAVSKLSAEDQKAFEEYRAEVELGRNMAGRLLQFYGSVGDDKLTGYVNQVGTYVGSYSDYPERKYMFDVLDSDSVNAFACPGGYILVTKGALRLAETEAELGMILGHEVAHVGKKHMFNTLKTMSQKEMAEKSKATENERSSDPTLTTRKRPEPEESEAGKALAKYMSGGSAGFSILQAAKAGMNVMLEKGLDKDLEFEADHEGVKYGVRSGYEPLALWNFLERLKQKKKSLNMKVIESTHPKADERQERIITLLREMKAKDITGADGKARFEKAKARIPKEKA